MPPADVRIESDDKWMFVVVDGKRIAKRDHREAGGAWISLEPAYTVRNCSGGTSIEIEYRGLRRRPEAKVH